MSTHTPGPWYLKSRHEGIIVTRHGATIATVFADKNRPLIVSAPEMYATLESIANMPHEITATYLCAVARGMLAKIRLQS